MRMEAARVGRWIVGNEKTAGFEPAVFSCFYNQVVDYFITLQVVVVPSL